MSGRPPTSDEATARGLLMEKGIHTFSNGSEWDCWSEPNCYACRWFDKDVMGADCAFEFAAFVHMVTPELATMFGWIQDKQWDEPNDHRHGWDAPEQCAFFRDKDQGDDDRPSVAPVDPAQMTFLVPDGFPAVVPEPATCLT